MSDVNHISNKFICIECGNEFIRFEQLKQHYSTIHFQEISLNNSNSFNCEMCHKSFESKSSLTSHKKVHMMKTFECEICEKSFSHKANLIRHKRVHTGERPYKCDVCVNGVNDYTGCVSKI